jgi:2-dehydropantoate 2-reductase
MRIVVVGAGGVGGYFGGKLCQSGNEVVFLTRGRALEAIRENGLKVKSYLGDFKVHPEVSDRPESVRGADLVMLCTKSWQIDEVGASIRPYLDEKAVVLPLQNGADNAERLQKILPSKNVIGGLCKIVSKIESPGVIHHFTFVPEVIFGELHQEISPRCQKIKAAFDGAGFKNKLSENIQRDIWLKFLFITSISALGALTRSVLGIMREDPFLRKKITETAAEIIEVGKRLGVDMDEKDIQIALDMIDKGEFSTTMSLQRDMMEGHPSELENFNGYIVHKGDELGIDTPVNDFIYYSLLPMEKKSRGLS